MQKKKPGCLTIGFIVIAVIVGGFFGSAFMVGMIQGISESINGDPEETEPSRSVVTAIDEPETAPEIYTLSDPSPASPETEQPPETSVPAAPLETVPEAVAETEPETEPEPVAETVPETVAETEPETEPEILTISEPEEAAPIVTRETPASSDPLFPEYEREETTEYVLNISSKKIHKPTCGDVKKIKPENYSTTTDLETYLAQGYTYCGHCW